MTKRELIDRLADVGDDVNVIIGVMFMNGAWGEGDFYHIDDVHIDDTETVITCTVDVNKIPNR